MQTVVLVLMILVCFNFILKQTYCKRWAVAAISLTCALFTGIIWPYAIEQSKTQIADWLGNPSLMLDTSVILSVEVCLQLAFCMLAVNILTSGKVNNRTLWIYRVLRWFPSFLIFPVLFSTLVWLIFSFPGTSFSLIAWSMAIAVLLFIPLGTLFLRWLLPEKELRLELLFITNSLTAVLGIVATVNGRTAMKGIGEVDWIAFGGMVGLVISGGFLGIALRRYQINRMNRTK